MQSHIWPHRWTVRHALPAWNFALPDETMFMEQPPGFEYPDKHDWVATPEEYLWDEAGHPCLEQNVQQHRHWVEFRLASVANGVFTCVAPPPG